MIVKKIPVSSADLHQLEHQNWLPVDHVAVSFEIQHDGSSILLKYQVNESQVRAVNTAFNSPVWEDSCVEFFISPEGDENYYNFEFNAIGTALGAYGGDRNNRDWLPEEVLKTIDTNPSLGKGIIETLEGKISWTLEVRLPVAVLCHSNIKDLSGMKATGNFYKCGDRLKKPHFLSWQPVLTEKPDFHSPEFFGKLRFQ